MQLITIIMSDSIVYRKSSKVPSSNLLHWESFDRKVVTPFEDQKLSLYEKMMDISLHQKNDGKEWLQ